MHSSRDQTQTPKRPLSNYMIKKPNWIPDLELTDRNVGAAAERPDYRAVPDRKTEEELQLRAGIVKSSRTTRHTSNNERSRQEFEGDTTSTVSWGSEVPDFHGSSASRNRGNSAGVPDSSASSRNTRYSARPISSRAPPFACHVELDANEAGNYTSSRRATQRVTTRRNDEAAQYKQEESARHHNINNNKNAGGRPATSHDSSTESSESEASLTETIETMPTKRSVKSLNRHQKPQRPSKSDEMGRVRRDNHCDERDEHDEHDNDRNDAAVQQDMVEYWHGKVEKRWLANTRNDRQMQSEASSRLNQVNNSKRFACRDATLSSTNDTQNAESAEAAASAARLGFKCRIQSSSADSLRDLHGFCFVRDNSLSIYEYKRVGSGKNAKIVPLIKRQTFLHEAGWRVGTPIGLADIFTGNELTLLPNDWTESISPHLVTNAGTRDHANGKHGGKRDLIRILLMDVDDVKQRDFIKQELTVRHGVPSESLFPVMAKLHVSRLLFHPTMLQQLEQAREVLRENLARQERCLIQAYTGLYAFYRNLCVDLGGSTNSVKLTRRQLQLGLARLEFPVDRCDLDVFWRAAEHLYLPGDSEQSQVDQEWKLNFHEWMRIVLGEMPEWRRELIVEAYLKLDGNAQRGFVTENDVHRFYRIAPSTAAELCANISGVNGRNVLPIDILSFLSRLGQFTQQKNRISWTEFQIFYEGLNYALSPVQSIGQSRRFADDENKSDNDDLFEDIVLIGWNLDSNKHRR